MKFRLAGCRILNVAQTTPEEISGLSDDFADAGWGLSEVEVIAYPNHVVRGEGDLVFAGPAADKEI